MRVLDQIGLGKGTLCSTPKPLNGAVNEASYAWNNTQPNGPKVTIHSGAPVNPTFVEGRDYFNSAPPFAYKPYTYPHPLVSGVPRPPAFKLSPRLIGPPMDDPLSIAVAIGLSLASSATRVNDSLPLPGAAIG